MKPTAVALLIESKDHKVLLELRDDDSIYSGNWSLFDGVLQKCDWRGDVYKSIERCARRLIGEKLKLKVGEYRLPFNPRYLELFHSGNYDFGSLCFDQYVFATSFNLPYDMLALEKGKEMALFGLDQIKDMTIAANYKKVIEYYLSKRLNFGQI